METTIKKMYSNTQSVVAYVVTNKLDPRSIGIVINRPNGAYGESAWFTLTFRKKTSRELEEAVGKEKALQYAERQEVRVAGKSLLPKLETLLTGEEGEGLYKKLATYQEDKVVSEAEAQAVLNAFIQLIKADELCISHMDVYDEQSGEIELSKPIAHLRGSGTSAEVSNLTW